MIDKEDINNLVKVSTFARKAEFSTKYAYDLIKEQKIDIVLIDGVKFVDLRNLPEKIKARIKN